MTGASVKCELSESAFKTEFSANGGLQDCSGQGEGHASSSLVGHADAANGNAGGDGSGMVPSVPTKQRLLIKIPRSAVTAATAHAAEVAATKGSGSSKVGAKAASTPGAKGCKIGKAAHSQAASDLAAMELRQGKRGKSGKGGVKRSRPPPGTRAPPPPPPPVPMSRQVCA